MEELNKAMQILIDILFKTAGRKEINRTIKEVIELLEIAKKKLR